MSQNHGPHYQCNPEALGDTGSPNTASVSPPQPDYTAMNDDVLYRLARERDIPKRSYLDRDALIDALRNHIG